MSPLAEIESAVPSFGLQELADLEQLSPTPRLKRESQSLPSPLNLPPLNLGVRLQPLTPDEDSVEETMDDAKF